MELTEEAEQSGFFEFWLLLKGDYPVTFPITTYGFDIYMDHNQRLRRDLFYCYYLLYAVWTLFRLSEEKVQVRRRAICYHGTPDEECMLFVYFA